MGAHTSPRADLLTVMVAVALAAGCQHDPIDTTVGRSGYFDLERFVTLQDSLHAGQRILKKVRVNDVVEEHEIRDIDWGLELAPFAGANINKVALLGKYRVDSTRLADGGLQIRYVALDSTLRTRRLEIVEGPGGRAGDVRSVRLNTASETALASLRQRLAWTRNAYEIESYQDALFMPERTLVVEAHVIE